MNGEKGEAPLQVSDVNEYAKQDFESYSQQVQNYFAMAHDPGRGSAL